MMEYVRRPVTITVCLHVEECLSSVELWSDRPGDKRQIFSGCETCDRASQSGSGLHLGRLFLVQA